jgi:hypothetical protein
MFISGFSFLVREYVGSIDVISPYELNPVAVDIYKRIVNVAQGVRLNLFMGVNPSLGEIFELGSPDLNRGIGQGYWARKV